MVLFGAAVAHGRSNAEFEAHVAEGKRLYANEDYDKALAEFTLAYRLDPDSWILLNMGRCHYKAGRPQVALDFYNQLLKFKLTAEQRKEVMKSIGLATVRQGEQQTAAATNAGTASAATPAAAQSPASLTSPLTQAPASVPVYRKGWFWGVVGGSVVVVGLALGLGLGLGLRSSQNAGPVDVIGF